MRSRTVKNLDEGSGELPRDLADALADLGVAEEEAKEDGFPIPSRELLLTSEELLRRLYKVWPRRFEVYPSPDGEIAIDARNDRGLRSWSCANPEGRCFAWCTLTASSRATGIRRLKTFRMISCLEP